MEIGDIFTKKNYTQYAIFANENNLMIVDLCDGKYQLVKIPAMTDKSIKEIQVYELKSKLAATDYICIKIAEGAATHAEYAEIIAQRQAWRAEINRLEQENEQTNGVNTGGAN